MRRREIMMFVGGAAAAWPHAMHAQEAVRIYRLGVMIPSTKIASHVTASYTQSCPHRASQMRRPCARQSAAETAEDLRRDRSTGHVSTGIGREKRRHRAGPRLEPIRRAPASFA